MTIPGRCLLLPSMLFAACATTTPAPADPAGGAVVLSLETADRLELVGARVTSTTHQGWRAIRIDPVEADDPRPLLAIVRDLQMTDGEIELEVSGAPGPGAPAEVRGFIGIAFHVRDGGARFENIYLRPSNGRAEDQLRRNHAVQYQSSPAYGWKRLRDESPGQYESYADLQPGVWTRMRVKVSGTRAELYLDGAPQPCLVVRDLKLGTTGGAVALWTDPTTEAYFRDLRVHPRPRL